MITVIIVLERRTWRCPRRKEIIGHFSTFAMFFSRSSCVFFFQRHSLCGFGLSGSHSTPRKDHFQKYKERKKRTKNVLDICSPSSENCLGFSFASAFAFSGQEREQHKKIGAEIMIAVELKSP